MPMPSIRFDSQSRRARLSVDDPGGRQSGPQTGNGKGDDPNLQRRASRYQRSGVSGNFDGFVARELAERKQFWFPPLQAYCLRHPPLFP